MPMYEIRQTETYRNWEARLKDWRARAVISDRLARVAAGHLGDWKHLGDGVGEFRIHYGSGYRLYFTRRGTEIIILLCGGHKGSQQRDIDLAKRLASDLER